MKLPEYEITGTAVRLNQMEPPVYKGRAHLISSLLEAHKRAAICNFNSISTATLLNAYAGSGSVIQSIAAALLTTGNAHAPLTGTREALNYFLKTGAALPSVVNGKERYLGLGNSFYKDKIDPSFQDAYLEFLLYLQFYEKSNLLERYATQVSEITGKMLFPNAAGITAAICLELNDEDFAEVSYFIQGRVRGWTYLLSHYKL